MLWKPSEPTCSHSLVDGQKSRTAKNTYTVSMKTPLAWRAVLFAVVVSLTTLAYILSDLIGTRGQAMIGFVVFLAFVAAFSKNLRAVNPRTLICGILLQFLLASLVLHVEPVREMFYAVGRGIQKVLDVSARGSEFVFGPLVEPTRIPTDPHGALGGGAGVTFAGQLPPKRAPFIFAFVALPPIIFVSGLFSVLYYFGVLQFFVRVMARVMAVLMRTSGAETLSVSANVFMGQTEAPLIVKPFVPKMTKSELLALMASGMAHVSGGMMAVYIGYTSDLLGSNKEAAAAAILITCVMACPCSLYLTKLLLPETEQPETMGNAPIKVPSHAANPIDALAAGISDGLKLAINVAAMLIGFIAMIALINLLIGGIKPLLIDVGFSTHSLAWWPDELTLEHMMGWVFRPAALLIGVPPDETGKVGSLLGIKLIANEHVAFINFTKDPFYRNLSDRAKLLAIYALTGFANFASIGIQLGGIGAIAESRRHDLAKLGMRALFIGFIATLVNASVAGILIR